MSFTFVNNAQTTLAAAASSSDTTLTIASSTNFPSSLSGGEILTITLNDAATRQIFEICYVTAISGTSLTVTRGEEGTSAQNWSIGDYAYCAVTAGEMSNLVTGRLLNVQIFSTAGTSTYTPSTGTASVVVEVQGAGGAGAGAPITGSGNCSAGEPGAAGGYAKSRLTSGFSGASVVVGAKGTGGTGNGASGGNSSFGAGITGPGGTGGLAGPILAVPTANGNGTQSSGSGGNIVNESGGCGQESVVIDITGNVGYGASGGQSHFGAGAAAVSANTNGSDGSSPGSGASGVCSTNNTGTLTGGNGADGIVIVWEYA